MGFPRIIRNLWLPENAVANANPTAQNLTASYVILGAQMDITGYEALSIKMRHTATGAGKTMSFKVYASDDEMSVEDASSVWHQLGGQENVAGALTEEPWEYTGDAATGAGTHGLCPLDFDNLGYKKMKLMVKGSDASGSCLASIGVTRGHG